VTIGIPAPLVSAGAGIPPVCVRHGEPAVKTKKVLFRSYTPRWTYLLILFGLIPFAIVAAVLQKRVKAPAWPFCARCGQLQRTRLLTGIALVVLAVLGVALLAGVLPEDSAYGGVAILGFVVLVLVGLGIASLSARSAIAAGHVTRDGSMVELRGPHPDFAEAVVAAQQQSMQQYPAQPYGPFAYPPDHADGS
jgi:hypothetical protein